MPRGSQDSKDAMDQATLLVVLQLTACADELGGFGCAVCDSREVCERHFDVATANRVDMIQRFAEWHREVLWPKRRATLVAGKRA